jgi:hypothetical protein
MRVGTSVRTAAGYEATVIGNDGDDWVHVEYDTYPHDKVWLVTSSITQRLTEGE